MFEYLYVTGLNRPTFEVFHGTKTTFPFGTKTPPLKFPTERPGGTTVEKRPVAGLKNPTFDAFCGTKSTRPSGKRTEPP